MSSNYRNDELGRLVGTMCDGTITADETGRLDSLLAGDEEARQFYNNYMFLHAELYSQHASVEAVESVGKCGVGSVECGVRVVDSSEIKPQSAIRNPKFVGWLAIAATLVGV